MTDQDLPSRRKLLLPTLVTVLAVLGAGSLAIATFTPDDSNAFLAPIHSPERFQTRTNPPSPSAGDPAPGPASPTVTVSELADPIWVNRIAAAANIPERAAAAYAGAAIETNRTNPSCGLGWNTLAAIGLVESEHGTMHGARIGPDGRASPNILGIPLNGNGTTEVPDTDLGHLDNDTMWDRAVGPMQFIPSTWAKHAQDGDGDGKADINQIDDAALTAAAYLCATGGDLTRAENWIAAIAAYNPSADYNNRVADAANHYAKVK